MSNALENIDNSAAWKTTYECLSSESVRQMLRDRGLTISKFAELLNCSERQARYYVSREKELSPLELLGLESLPKKRGRKKQD